MTRRLILESLPTRQAEFFKQNPRSAVTYMPPIKVSCAQAKGSYFSRGPSAWGLVSISKNGSPWARCLPDMFHEYALSKPTATNRAPADQLLRNWLSEGRLQQSQLT